MAKSNPDGTGNRDRQRNGAIIGERLAQRPQTMRATPRQSDAAAKQDRSASAEREGSTLGSST